MVTKANCSHIVLRVFAVTVLTIPIFLNWSPPVLAGDGDLDTTFGTNGIVTTPVGSLSTEGGYSALQPDGRIVVAGSTDNGSNYDFVVVRYNSDGSPDTAFGTAGKVITPVGNGHDFVRGVLIQSDGEIVVAGFSNNGSNYDFAVVRYNGNGSLDTHFGTNGKVITPIGSGDDGGWDLAIQSNGKIIVAGYGNNGHDDDFAIVRYNSDGSLDTNFGTGGKVVTSFGSYTGIGDRAQSVTIQSDGKIVAAGHGYGSYPDIVLARYNSDGSLDSGFGIGGKVVTPIGDTADWGEAVVIQDNGKIVVVGSTQISSTNNDFVVVRYNSDGSLDTGFGTNGKIITPIGGDDWGTDVALQPDGKTVVGGYSRSGSYYDFAVVRYHTTGELDSTFGSSGIVVTPIDSARLALGRSIATQSDGKIIMAGYSWDGARYVLALARYEAHFTLPALLTNHDNGQPGSFFTLGGSDFPPNSTATIIINGHTLTDTIAVNSSGNLTLLLDTTAAEPGRYFVTAAVNPSARAAFTLDPNAPLRPQEGSGPILIVPSGIAFTEFVYLPLVQR